jgi:hypothetical protein
MVHDELQKVVVSVKTNQKKIALNLLIVMWCLQVSLARGATPLSRGSKVVHVDSKIKR